MRLVLAGVGTMIGYAILNCLPISSTVTMTEVVGSGCYGNSYYNRIVMHNMHELSQKTNCRMLACSSVHTWSSRLSLNSLFWSVDVLGYPQPSPGFFFSHTVFQILNSLRSLCFYSNNPLIWNEIVLNPAKIVSHFKVSFLDFICRTAQE